MKLCHYCLTCLRAASPLPTRLEAAEDLPRAAAVPQNSLLQQSQQRSFTEPGQESTDRPHLVIPESQSLIFTDNSAIKLPKKTKKRPKKKKEVTREEGRHEPLPRDAKPHKSILKRR